MWRRRAQRWGWKAPTSPTHTSSWCRSGTSQRCVAACLPACMFNVPLVLAVAGVVRSFGCTVWSAPCHALRVAQVLSGQPAWQQAMPLGLLRACCPACHHPNPLTIPPHPTSHHKQSFQTVTEDLKRRFAVNGEPLIDESVVGSLSRGASPHFLAGSYKRQTGFQLPPGALQLSSSGALD